MPDSDIKAEIAEAQEAVSDALQRLANAQLAESPQRVLVTDWAAVLETTDGETPGIRVAFSEKMTSWKVPGMANHLHRVTQSFL